MYQSHWEVSNALDVLGRYRISYKNALFCMYSTDFYKFLHSSNELPEFYFYFYLKQDIIFPFICVIDLRKQRKILTAYLIFM